ncbi:XdhC family protein [Desulfitobacterium sp. AusDCA]|uniref:XdhC family protein n=1 Tax=Desulfitobacterium sp. AusDCA TaxID=3240383 RepID=UPI003DA786E2
MELNLMRLLAECQEENKEVALITVISSENVKNCVTGSMMLINENGETLAGGIGNEIFQPKAIKQGQICIKRGLSRKSLISVEKNSVEIFVQAFCNDDRLIIIGAGTLAQTIYKLARILGYRITVVDNRPEMLTKERFLGANELLLGDIIENLDLCTITENTNIVIATHHHEFDERALQAVISSPARYIGVLGNRRRVAEYFSNLKHLNVAEELVDRVYSPIGLDLGGRKTSEIALAVMAEIQAVKFQRNGGFLKKEEC